MEARNEKGWNGTFSRDNLPKQIKDTENGIINMDRQNSSGTHWVAYFNSPKFKQVLYFDSFGLTPPKEIEKYLRTSGKKIMLNSAQIQANKSIMCGYYSMYWIIELNKGRDLYDVLYEMQPKPSISNEIKMRRYFNIKQKVEFN